jgi:hypothetical protein
MLFDLFLCLSYNWFCLSVCFFVYMFLCLFASLSICSFVYLFLCLFVSFPNCFFVCLFLCLSCYWFCLYICFLVYKFLSVYRPVFFVSLFIQSIYLSVFICLSPSVHLSSYLSDLVSHSVFCFVVHIS